MSLPLIKVAPARIRTTRWGALTARQQPGRYTITAANPMHDDLRHALEAITGAN
jgi:hypothetical protein